MPDPVLDLVLEDARVRTLDPRHPQARRIGVWNGRIVGRDDEIAGLTARQTVRLDGATVLPGFVDAHTHLGWSGRSAQSLDLSAAGSRAQLLAAIAAHVANTEGEWLDAVGYDQRSLDGVHITAAELDTVTGGRKAYLLHRSGHACAVNSAVLAEIDPAELAAGGGNVVRDATGAPTGVLLEAAQAPVQELRRPYELTEMISSLRLAADQCLAQGITTCAEAGIAAGLAGASPIELMAYQRADLPIRVQLMVSDLMLHPLAGAPADGVTTGLDLGLGTGFGGDRLWLGAMKMWLDGGVQARTAALTEPFAGTDNRGELAGDPAQLRAKIVAAHVSGWQLALHAIGDRAIDLAIEALTEAQRALPRPDARHRIEHCGIVRPDQLAGLAACGAIAVIQPEFLWYNAEDYNRVLGPPRADWQYRGRALLDAGVPVVGSSDRPVVPGNPLQGIRFMVERRSSTGIVVGPAEGMTVDEALHAYTLAGAHSIGREHDLGSITPRKWADLVVLDADPHEVAPERLSEISVRATYVAGDRAYEA